MAQLSPNLREKAANRQPPLLSLTAHSSGKGKNIRALRQADAQPASRKLDCCRRNFGASAMAEIVPLTAFLRIYPRITPQSKLNECVALFTSTHNEEPPCGDWFVTGGIRLPFLPTKWSTVHTPNPSNSRRVRAAAYSSRIAVTGFRRIARRAGR